MNAQNFQEEKIQDLIQNGYEFDIGYYLSKGYEILKENFGNFIGYTVLYILIAIIGSLIPGIGTIVSIVLPAPLVAGFYIVARKINKDKSYEFGDFFKGFDFFLQLFLSALISGIFVIVGLLLLIIPGLYLCVAYSFTSFFIVFNNMEFWPAMEASRKLITRNWFPVFGFFLVLGIINLLGLLCLGVGLLFTIPLTSCAMYAAFEDVVGTEE